MTQDQKDDLCATFDRIKEAIQANQLVEHTERIDYDPKYDDSMQVERFIPRAWSLDIAIKTKNMGKDTVMNVKVSMNL